MGRAAALAKTLIATWTIEKSVGMRPAKRRAG
jgi:hypothetical protein